MKERRQQHDSHLVTYLGQATLMVYVQLPSMTTKTEKYGDDIPPGWVKITVAHGSTSGSRADAYWITPKLKYKLRSKQTVP